VATAGTRATGDAKSIVAIVGKFTLRSIFVAAVAQR
jgi:hypothetical protein